MYTAAISLLLHSFFLSLRLRGRNGAFPRPLTPQEEQEALTALSQGDAAARERLILHNMRLVAHVVKKFYVGASDQDDIISIGTIGLVKAIDSYKDDKSAKLPTYACRCIQNEIYMHFRGRRKHAGDVYLSDSLDSDGDGAPLTVMDVLQTEDYTQERLEQAEIYSNLVTLVEQLPDERMRKIVKLRYGLDGRAPLTQREAAGELGISRSYISRIEKKALGLLEGWLREQDSE